MNLLKQHQKYINAGKPYTRVNTSDTEYFIILGTKVQETCKANSYIGENHLGETKIMSLKNYRLISEEGMGAVYDNYIITLNSEYKEHPYEWVKDQLYLNISSPIFKNQLPVPYTVNLRVDTGSTLMILSPNSINLQYLMNNEEFPLGKDNYKFIPVPIFGYANALMVSSYFYLTKFNSVMDTSMVKLTYFILDTATPNLERIESGLFGIGLQNYSFTNSSGYTINIGSPIQEILKASHNLNIHSDYTFATVDASNYKIIVSKNFDSNYQFFKTKLLSNATSILSNSQIKLNIQNFSIDLSNNILFDTGNQAAKFYLESGEMEKLYKLYPSYFIKVDQSQYPNINSHGYPIIPKIYNKCIYYNIDNTNITLTLDNINYTFLSSNAFISGRMLLFCDVTQMGTQFNTIIGPSIFKNLTTLVYDICRNQMGLKIS